MNPFLRLRILELAGVLAGPSVGRYFAELGAAVTKIENPNTLGDVTRQWKSPNEPCPQDEPGSYYLSVNEGKKTMFLDLKNYSDKKIFFDLLQSTDILLTNYPHRKEKILHSNGFKGLLNEYPALIWVNICGYASEPERPAYDLIIQAESGFMDMNRLTENEPQKLPVALMDIIAGHRAYEAALAALWRREITGKGLFAEVYLYESALASWYNQSALYLVYGIEPRPSGSLHPHIAPYGEIFNTSEGKQMVVAIGNDRQFDDLCEVLESEPLKNDLRFRNNSLRVEHRKELYSFLSQAFSKFSSEIIMERCRVKQIPVGIIRSLSEALDHAHPMLNNQHAKTLNTTVFRAWDYEGNQIL